MAFAQSKVDQLAADVTSYSSKWAIVVGCFSAGVAVLAAAGGYTTGAFFGSPTVGKQVYDNIEESLPRVPRGAPRIRDWYVERKAIVGQAFDHLGIGSSAADASGEPRMVGLAGPGGAGKSTVASMVVAREDVRAFFQKGVLWLPVGQEAEHRLPALMFNLAEMVYETVMRKTCRPPRKDDLKNEPEDGAAYIREVVDESSRRFLVVADDVWEVGVLRELKRAGLWVLYTGRDGDLLSEAPTIRLDQVLKEEAEMVLRRAADLHDDADLPDAAYDLMELCEYGVMRLAFVGRWVHGRNDRQVWQAVLERIKNAQGGGDDGRPVPWRAAVLRAGVEELSYDNIQNKELYLSLAILPKGLAFPSEVAAVLLYGAECSTEDRKAAERVLATLERFSILTLEDGGEYRVHDDHADFIQGRSAVNQDVRNRVLPRWREYVSSVRALLAFSGDGLAGIWDMLAQTKSEGIPLRPYDAALDAMDPSSADRPTALAAAADYHAWREDWPAAFDKNFEVLKIQEDRVDVDHPSIATTLTSLGICAEKVGRTEEAESFLQRALNIQEKLVVDHPDVDVATALLNLGSCAYSAGRIEKADGIVRRALAIQEEKLGVNHLDLTFTLKLLGECAMFAGNMEAAEEVYRRLLAIEEEKLGVDHLDVAFTLNRLALCAKNTGKTEDAEELHRRALTIELGVDDADILSGFGLRAYLDMLTEEADEFYRRALTIREEKLGVEHPDVAHTLDQLGACAYRAGRTEEAEGFLRRSLAIQKEQGVARLDMAITLTNLGLYARDRGKIEEAQDFYGRALTIREEELGIDHPDVAFSLQRLGLCANRAGRNQEAEELFGQALAILEEKLGVDHPNAKETRGLLKKLRRKTSPSSVCTVASLADNMLVMSVGVALVALKGRKTRPSKRCSE